MKHPFQSPAVKATYDAMEPDHRAGLMSIRELIFDTAANLSVGPIAESLKWGQPSYTTGDTKTATPIRLGVTTSGDLAIFTHCQTSVISDFRALAPADMRFDGNRALHLPTAKPLPLAAISPLIRNALTYRV